MVDFTLLNLSAWILLTLLQFTVGPYFLRLIGARSVDGGWALGRVAGWLTVSLVLWFLGHLNLPVNTVGGVRATFLVTLMVGGWLMIKNRREIRKILWEKKWLIL